MTHSGTATCTVGRVKEVGSVGVAAGVCAVSKTSVHKADKNTVMPSSIDAEPRCARLADDEVAAAEGAAEAQLTEW